MKYKHNLVLFCIIIFNYVLPQSSNDSLQNIWINKKLPDSVRFNALSIFYINNHQSFPDSTLKVLDYYYQLAIDKKSKIELYNVANDRAGIYRFKGQDELAMKYYLEAQKYAIELKNIKFQAAISGNIGNVYVQKKNYLKATQCFTNALNLYKENKDLKGESHMLTSLGSVFLIIQNYDLALEYYKKALEIQKTITLEPRRIAVIYINIGWTNFEKRNFVKAKENYEKALEILNETNLNFFIVECYSTLARIHLELKNLETAKYYVNKSLKIYNELSINNGILLSKIINAKIISHTDIDKSIAICEPLLNEINKTNEKEIKKEVYNFLYNCYKIKKEHEKSLKMLELFTKINDSIRIEKNNFTIIREAIKKDFEIKLIENKEKIENLKKEQKLKLYLILSISLFLVIIVIIVFIKKTINNNKIKIELLNEISNLKIDSDKKFLIETNKFILNKDNIEKSIKRKLNDTDWKVLNTLLENPEITNKELAEKVFLSIDGLGSSLRRMYDYFDIKETKYKKIALISNAIKRSTN